MRAVVAGLLGVVLIAAVTVPQGAFAQDSQQDPVADAMAAVTGYTSAWDAVPRDIASLSQYSDGLEELDRQYRSLAGVLRPELRGLGAAVSRLTDHLAALGSERESIEGALAQAQARQAVQERQVGALARLLYQQPSPDLTAVAQMMDGQDLRAFDRQNLVTGVLTSKAAELQRIIAEVERLRQQLDAKLREIQQTKEELSGTTARRDAVAAKQAVVDTALRGVRTDLDRARGEIDAIRRAEAEALRAAAEAAARAAAAAAQAAKVSGSARPSGGGTPARSSGEFSTLLPGGIPYRDVFLTYGTKYRVEPALLAAIARQESGFNPWAGCDRVGAGKGIMQLENKPQYCGPDAVAASVETAAKMLASYYNRSGSWTAAVFAYNNGPGLMDQWVRYSEDTSAILSVLAAYYNKQPYAAPGPKDGYASWGEWRARVAYSYASAAPLPGFHSATQKWFIYRQG